MFPLDVPPCSCACCSTVDNMKLFRSVLFAVSTTYLYPHNTSLGQELVRLFDLPSLDSQSPGRNKDDDINDFAANGVDSEYLPEFEMRLRMFETSLPSSSWRRKTKNSRIFKKKPQPTECVFCKKNGEAEEKYRSHTLKTPLGLVTCPVLRTFTCPICQATGDVAHTIKYCPFMADTRSVNMTQKTRGKSRRRKSSV